MAEVLTAHLRDYWWKYDPDLLNKKMRAQVWPSALTPMLFQILEYCGAERALRAEFARWATGVRCGLKESPSGLYFVSPLTPRSKAFDREIDESLPSFRKAGYLAKDLLFNKGVAGRIQPRPADSGPLLSTEDLVKLDILRELRKFIKPEDFKSRKFASIDRTTRSKLRQGRIDQLSVRTLSKIIDLVRQWKRPAST